MNATILAAAGLAAVIVTACSSAGSPLVAPTTPGGPLATGTAAASQGNVAVRFVNLYLYGTTPTDLDVIAGGDPHGTVLSTVRYGHVSDAVNVPIDPTVGTILYTLTAAGQHSSIVAEPAPQHMKNGDRATVLIYPGGADIFSETDTSLPSGPVHAAPAVPAGKAILTMDFAAVSSGNITDDPNGVVGAQWGIPGKGCQHNPANAGPDGTVSITQGTEDIVLDPGDVQWTVWDANHTGCTGDPAFQATTVTLSAGKRTYVFEYSTSQHAADIKLMVVQA